MKKSILNIGKALEKSEQKQINGGGRVKCQPSGQACATAAHCWSDAGCVGFPSDYLCIGGVCHFNPF